MEDLTAKENELLRKNLEFYDSLDSGERTPVTKSQKQFVRVCINFDLENYRVVSAGRL